MVVVVVEDAGVVVAVALFFWFFSLLPKPRREEPQLFLLRITPPLGEVAFTDKSRISVVGLPVSLPSLLNRPELGKGILLTSRNLLPRMSKLLVLLLLLLIAVANREGDEGEVEEARFASSTQSKSLSEMVENRLSS